MAEQLSGDPNSSQETWVWGTVVACQANFYWVQLDPQDLLTQVNQRPKDALKVIQPRFLCTRRARLKKLGQQVLVGDRVVVEELDWQTQRAAIATIAPRHSQLDRPPIANANQILLMFALATPPLDPHQLTRFLVKAESTGMAVSLCLNKRDLVTEMELTAWQARLQAWGYTPATLSLQMDEALTPDLLAILQGRTTVVAGPSGVGKSSLINRLLPERHLRTGTVSGKLGRGRHTTRHIELFELPFGGFLADTPGFNQPDITCTVEQLSHCFPEIRQHLAHQPCQFNDCWHRDEPGCQVRGDWERYPEYLTLLEEVWHYQQTLDQRPHQDATEKIKVGNEGQIHHEPRLSAKKYRRPSRRSHHQDMQDLKLDLTDIKNWDDLEEND